MLFNWIPFQVGGGAAVGVVPEGLPRLPVPALPVQVLPQPPDKFHNNPVTKLEMNLYCCSHVLDIIEE